MLFSHSIVPNSLKPHGLHHARLPCPSLSLGVCSNSCPLSQWCHPTILSSVAPFSYCLQSFPASEFFPISWLFASGGQSTGASGIASVFPMNIQGCFPLGLTGLITLLFKRLSRVFSVPQFENSVDSTPFVKIFRNTLIKVTVHSNGLEVQQSALCLSWTMTFLGMIEIKTCKKQVR